MRISRTGITHFLFVVLIGVVLAACQPATGADTASLRAAIVADFPTVDGSTTAGPLLRLVACRLYDAKCDWTSQTEENAQRTIEPDASVPAEVAEKITGIKTSATGPAFMALIAGETDVIVEARGPSADERAAAEAAGVTLEMKPLAIDGLVMLANRDNPISDISTQQIIDIYTGKVTTWAELGVHIDSGGDEPQMIHGYQRQRNSGSQELIDTLIFHGTPMIDAPDLITTSMTGPYNAIGGSPFTGGGDVLGLGYSVYYYATAMFPDEFVKLLAVNGVMPTPDTIASGEYPLAAEVYIIIRADAPEGGRARAFRDWMLSDEGQRLVVESGYVPIREVK